MEEAKTKTKARDNRSSWIEFQVNKSRGKGANGAQTEVHAIEDTLERGLRSSRTVMHVACT